MRQSEPEDKKKRSRLSTRLKNEVSSCGSEISTGRIISETANKSGHSLDTFEEQEPNAIKIPNNGTPDKTYFIDRNNNEYL